MVSKYLKSKERESQIFLSKSWKINITFAGGRGVVVLLVHVLDNLAKYENFVKFEMYLIGSVSLWESIFLYTFKIKFPI